MCRANLPSPVLEMLGATRTLAARDEPPFGLSPPNHETPTRGKRDCPRVFTADSCRELPQTLVPARARRFHRPPWVSGPYVVPSITWSPAQTCKVSPGRGRPPFRRRISPVPNCLAPSVRAVDWAELGATFPEARGRRMWCHRLRTAGQLFLSISTVPSRRARYWGHPLGPSFPKPWARRTATHPRKKPKPPAHARARSRLLRSLKNRFLSSEPEPLLKTPLESPASNYLRSLPPGPPATQSPCLRPPPEPQARGHAANGASGPQLSPTRNQAVWRMGP